MVNKKTFVVAVALLFGHGLFVFQACTSNVGEYIDSRMRIDTFSELMAFSRVMAVSALEPVGTDKKDGAEALNYRLTGEREVFVAERVESSRTMRNDVYQWKNMCDEGRYIAGYDPCPLDRGLYYPEDDGLRVSFLSIENDGSLLLLLSFEVKNGKADMRNIGGPEVEVSDIEQFARGNDFERVELR